MPDKILDLRPLSLNKWEHQLLRHCQMAWSQVPNGQYLPAFGRKRTAAKLIELGFLTEVKNVLQSPVDDWPPVVVLLPENYDAMVKAGAIWVVQPGEDEP
jgi:hypothetical protein